SYTRLPPLGLSSAIVSSCLLPRSQQGTFPLTIVGTSTKGSVNPHPFQLAAASRRPQTSSSQLRRSIRISPFPTTPSRGFTLSPSRPFRQSSRRPSSATIELITFVHLIPRPFIGRISTSDPRN